MHDIQIVFDTAGATHVGKVRVQNDDSYLVESDKGIWAVADGMGGHTAGDVASAIIIEELKSIESATSAADLLARCEQQVFVANSRLVQLADDRGIIIGSTIAILLIHHEDYACVWSGDSRVYRVRNGEIQQLTRDHTEAEELIAQGKLSREEARNWSGRNVITRAIGVENDPELEITHGVLSPGDAFVVCSDGLSSHVEDNEILSFVVSNSSQQACDSLIALTLDRGATDNVTVVVVRYQPPAVLPVQLSTDHGNIWE